MSNGSADASAMDICSLIANPERESTILLMLKNRAFAIAAAALVSVATLHAADWPQWQGPDRTRVSKETGLLKEWPKGGPPLVWTAAGLGGGYGSMAVAGDRVFVQSTRARSSIVVALNRAD